MTRAERDLALVRRALRGDAGARAELAARLACVARILAARNRRAGGPLSREELLDLIQDVQLTIWGKLASYEGRARFETWAFRFCHLGMLRLLERRHLRHERERLLSAEVLEDVPGDAARDGSGEEALASLLRHVTPREGQVVRLRFVESLDVEEIAGALAISKSSVKTLLYRALDKLRALAPTAGGPA